MSPISIGIPVPSMGKIVHRTVVGTDSETKVTLATNASFMAILNIGTKSIYIGGTGVTTAAYSQVIRPFGGYSFNYVSSGFNFYMIASTTENIKIGVFEDA